MAASQLISLKLDINEFYRLVTGSSVIIGECEVMLDPVLTGFKLIQLTVAATTRADWLIIAQLIAIASGSDAG